MWLTVPRAKPGPFISEPANEEELWTNVDYIIESTEVQLSRTYYAADALPVYNPWLGPDQFAGWLGADLILRPREHNTSWVVPFVQDWDDHPEFRIDHDNRWWKLYLKILQRLAEAGRDKWVTGFPDLHTGIDALSAIRGRERLLVDLLDHPAAVHRAMHQMTDLWKYVVDVVWDVIKKPGQGTSQWTLGWSARRFLCIGQMDFTCMIGPEMYHEFCWQDLVETCQYVDCSLYHLDGPGAIHHLPRICSVQELNSIQWIPGAGAPPPSQWISLLWRIQEFGKSLQVWPLLNCTMDELLDEVTVLCQELDPTRLFIVAEVDTVERADAILARVKEVCASNRKLTSQS